MKKIISIVLILLACKTADCQPMSSIAIDSLVERALRAFNVPGIAVGIVKDGKVIHAKGYGISSLNTGKHVDENTLFGIASNSKAFAVASLGMLVDEGKLKWDDKVRDYIPEFELYNPYVTEEFTIRDLLTHRSGLGLGAGDLMLFPDSNNFTIKDVIHNMRYLKPVSSFRTKFDYDNNLYVIAGEVVVRVSGMSWDEYVEEKIMKPLQMTQSAACYERLKNKTNVTEPHVPVDGKLQVVARDNFKIGHSAGGLCSNITDMCKWVTMLLAHGVYGGKDSLKLLSAAVLDEMWTPQTILPVRNAGAYNTHFSAYGMGFFLADVKGYKQVSHTGGLLGMVTQVTLIPELGLGIIVLTNQQAGSAFSAITNQIKDVYLGIPNTDRVKEYAELMYKKIATADKAVDSLWAEVKDINKKKPLVNNVTNYKGRYQDAWFGDVEIIEEMGKLRFESQRSYRLRGEMYYYKGNTYIVKWNDRSMEADAFVTFSLDEQGKGNGFTMKAISSLTDFSFDFQDLNFKKK